MREIKFRFWGPFGEWIKPDEMEQKKTMLYGDEFAWDAYEPINDLFSGLGNSDVVTMQFTGLRDKNGKEIYEGDIVKERNDDIKKVEFGRIGYDGTWNGLTGFGLVGWRGARKEDDGEDEFLELEYHDHPKELEVIGNIYENPELLEAK